jgi:hypothetical protein
MRVVLPEEIFHSAFSFGAGHIQTIEFAAQNINSGFFANRVNPGKPFAVVPKTPRVPRQNNENGKCPIFD